MDWNAKCRIHRRGWSERLALLCLLGFLVTLTGPIQVVAQDAQESEAPAELIDESEATSPELSEREPAQAGNGRNVTTVQIRGNKRIEADAIQARLASKEGEAFTLEKVRQDVDNLFKTGFFYDVQVNRETRPTGIELTYIVVEKPSIIEIAYEGNDEIEDEELAETSGLKPFEILNNTKIREAVEKIQKLYEDKGYFLARVTPNVADVAAGDSVRVEFRIAENDKVKVKRINFMGNRKLADGKLKGVMQTQEGGFFSFISGSGAYKQEAFERDVQLLQYVYFNEGYVQAKIDRPQVYVTPDKRGIYITVRVEEGERFDVGQVDFAGDLLFERDNLFAAVNIDETKVFKHETLLSDLRVLQAKYGDLGYAYANIIPRTRIREKDREVDITFEIDKGNKVYFNRINIVGNTKTRDKVVRRELMIREGELYNETRRRESMDNVRRLGYFEDVQFNQSTPPDNPDLMNIDIVVKERNTGSIQVGAGYSTFSGFIFNGSVNQINLFGRGQKLGISIDLSNKQSLFNFNFTEPFVFDTEWSAGFDAYQSRRTLSEYSETKQGGALRIGHPLAPFTRGYLRYKLDNTKITRDTDADPTIYPSGDEPGSADGVTSSLTATLEYDRRNDRFAPTDGLYSSLSLEYAGLGGDKDFTKGYASTRYYKKVFWEVVFRNNLTYGFIRPNGGDDVPFNELYLLGGANSLRGFDWYSVGRRVFSQRRYDTLRAQPAYAGLSDDEVRQLALVPFGGRQQLFYQTELEFPLISEAGIKGVVFYDIGQAEDKLSLGEFRHDVGFGFRWFSPIGPLRFEWGFPLDRRPELGERAVNFQFAIGSPF